MKNRLKEPRTWKLMNWIWKEDTIYAQATHLKKRQLFHHLTYFVYEMTEVKKIGSTWT